jgi:hypothetical protein
MDQQSVGHRTEPVAREAELLSLHRYYIWANQMRVLFDDKLKGARHGALEAVRRDGTIDIEIAMYMSLWYGCLYVVVEGWKECGFHEHEVDSLLTSPNVELLKRFRNGAFHYQKHYWDERFLAFIRAGDATASWVRALNTALGRFFLRTMSDNSTAPLQT